MEVEHEKVKLGQGLKWKEEFHYAFRTAAAAY